MDKKKNKPTNFRELWEVLGQPGTSIYPFKASVSADGHQDLRCVTGEKKLIFSGIYGFQDLYKMWQKRSWFSLGDKAVHYCWRFALISITLSINTTERLTNQPQFNPIVLPECFIMANLKPSSPHWVFNLMVLNFIWMSIKLIFCINILFYMNWLSRTADTKPELMMFYCNISASYLCLTTTCPFHTSSQWEYLEDDFHVFVCCRLILLVSE